VAATFVASLLPVVGNLVSNTMIVIVSVTQSVAVAGLSLAWLVLIHKLEYVLNAHIIGSRIRAQAWELLLAMLTLEALFGLAGLVTAPVIYAQLKHMLQERGLV
jgi:predicted PurR-regulated permease PerM